jgi:hypothetical protein
MFPQKAQISFLLIMPKRTPGFVDWRDDWRNCRAKKLLLQDFETGLVSLEMSYKEAQCLRTEYEEVEESKFKRNFASLRKSFGKEVTRARRDSEGFARDTEHPRSQTACLTKTRWDGSAAQALLRQDIQNNLHTKKKELWLSRPEYNMHFDLRKFRDHVYKEVARQKRLAKHAQQNTTP